MQAFPAEQLIYKKTL